MCAGRPSVCHLIERAKPPRESAGARCSRQAGIDLSYDSFRRQRPCRRLRADTNVIRCIDPSGQGLPFRVVLRFPMLTACVEMIASGVLGERMEEEPALKRISQLNELFPNGEVGSRSSVGPGGRSGGQEPERRRAVAVAGHAAVVARAFVEKDWLHALFEECGIERWDV